MTTEPTSSRVLWSAVATLALAVGVWWYVEWRSAPPPPPPVELPAK